MDLTPLTLDQLKVLAYDFIHVNETAQNNLQVVNQEIQKRLDANKPVPILGKKDALDTEK